MKTKKQRVYTVMGEMGNSTGRYTGELPSLGEAIRAIEQSDLPYCPLGDGGLRENDGRVTFTVRRPLVYCIVEHEPYRHDVGSHQVLGGSDQPIRIYGVSPELGRISEPWHDGRPGAQIWPAAKPGYCAASNFATQADCERALSDDVPDEWVGFILRRLGNYVRA